MLYGDESLLNLQANGKKNITDRLFEIRKSCLTESGEFSPAKFFERAKSIRRYGDPIEQTALEHLMVQPVIMPEKGIVLTGAQKDRIRSDLRELNEKQTDKVIISIEQGVVDNARNELEQRKGIWSEDVNKLIGKWIGEESVKRPPQKNIVMTGVQKDRIRSDLREMSEKNMNSVISLIEKGAMINALIEVRECNGVSSDEAQELIEKWIGRQCFARPPQSKQGDK